MDVDWENASFFQTSKERAFRNYGVKETLEIDQNLLNKNIKETSQIFNTHPGGLIWEFLNVTTHHKTKTSINKCRYPLAPLWLAVGLRPLQRVSLENEK